MDASAERKILASQIMMDVEITVGWDDSILEVAKKFTQYKVPAIPIINNENELLGTISWQQVIDVISKGLSLKNKVSSIITSNKYLSLQINDLINLDFNYEKYDIIYVCDKVILKGVIYISNILNVLKWENKILNRFYNLAKCYELVLNNCYDSILVADGQGKVLWFNTPAGQEIILSRNLVGESVDNIEEQGIYFPSVVRKVLDDNKIHTVIQNSSYNETTIVTGTPVFDDDGNIVRVVTISRDLNSLFTEIKESIDTQKLCILEDRLRDLDQKSGRAFSELRRLRESDYFDCESIECRSKIMKEITKQVKNIAMVDATVLILGESGVGKDVIATKIHHHSERAKGPFVKINCGAIPENLLESELFGYEAGAFTGAKKRRKLGLFEIAHGGTIFLDEIAEMPLNLQVKILTVLDNRTFMRVGGSESIFTDIRIISATNRDIFKMVKEGKFREDLFYRINVIPITIPPLRNRKEDIPDLIFHFIDIFNKKYKRNRILSQEVMNVLHYYDWPGNIRELKNLIERLVVIGSNDIIFVKDLPDDIYKKEVKVLSEYDINNDKTMSLKKAVQIFEYKLIKEAYNKYYSTAKVAEALEVNQSTISRKLQSAREWESK